MTNYTAGRRAEYRTIAVLEAAGYSCTRSASSKGMWDVVGVSATDVVLVQVKYGGRPAPSSYADFGEMRVPANVRRLVHWWRKGSGAPEVIPIG